MSWKKPLVAASLVSILVALAGLQFVASVALRARAQPYSWMHSVPAGLGTALERFTLRAPLPATLRLVLAREALARGDLALSERQAAHLTPSSDRLALDGDVAEARGDERAAARAYLAAGDAAALEEHVLLLAGRGRLAAALALQNEAIARLSDDRTQTAALAQAYYELGVLRQAQAERDAAGSPERLANALRSERAYVRAVRLAPLEERYLLALGNQRLNLGDIAAAEQMFARARDVDPASVEALTGLGDAALRRGDRRAARQYLERARARDANSDAVRRLAQRLGR